MTKYVTFCVAPLLSVDTCCSQDVLWRTKHSGVRAPVEMRVCSCAGVPGLMCLLTEDGVLSLEYMGSGTPPLSSLCSPSVHISRIHITFVAPAPHTNPARPWNQREMIVEMTALQHEIQEKQSGEGQAAPQATPKYTTVVYTLSFLGDKMKRADPLFFMQNVAVLQPFLCLCVCLCNLTATVLRCVLCDDFLFPVDFH